MKSKVILFFLLFINCGNSFDENKLLETQKWLASLKEPKHYTLKELKQIKSFTTPKSSTYLGNFNFEIKDEDFKYINNLESLESIILYNNYTGNKALKLLKGLKKVNRVVIWQTKITDPSMKYLNNFPELKKLVLYNTQITDKGIAYLIKNEKIEEISIITTKFKDTNNLNPEIEKVEHDISDKSVNYFRELKNLKLLILHYTKLTPQGVKLLKKSKKIKISYLSNNYPAYKDPIIRKQEKVSENDLDKSINLKW